MSTKVQITGGAFQDVSGNPLANGYLLLYLSQDGQVNSDQQIAAGIEIKVPLDANGNIVTSPPQYVWPNDVITPAGTFYTVSAYAADGQLVWGPNAVLILSTPSPYDIGAGWIPGAVSTSSMQVATYDIGVFFPGQYTASQVVLLLPFERTVFYANNFIPSVAAVGVNPTATAVFTLNKNGSEVGTISVNTSGVATFNSISSGVTTFNKGDVLTIVGPATPDATLANLGVNLSGSTVGAFVS